MSSEHKIVISQYGNAVYAACHCRGIDTKLRQGPNKIAIAKIDGLAHLQKTKKE